MTSGLGSNGPTSIPGPLSAATSGNLNKDGTPVLPSTGAGGGSVTPGGYSIWDIPTELIDYLNQLSGNDQGKLWFDIGQRQAQPPSWMISPENSDKMNSEIAKAALADYGSSNSAEHNQPTDPNRKESYDIMRRPDQVMMQFRAMEFNDPQKFLALQKVIAQGPWGSVPVGTWSDQMETAIGKAMLDYAKLSLGTTTSMSFMKYLTLTSNNFATAQAQSGQGAAPPIRLTDPTAIRASAQSAAEAALGRGLSQDQLDAFVKQFQGAQTKYQTAAPGGNVTLPSLSTDAMSFAQQENPKAYKQNQRQSFLDILVNMFAPSGSQRPNMTPVASVGSE